MIPETDLKPAIMSRPEWRYAVQRSHITCKSQEKDTRKLNAESAASNSSSNVSITNVDMRQSLGGRTILGPDEHIMHHVRKGKCSYLWRNTKIV